MQIKEKKGVPDGAERCLLDTVNLLIQKTRKNLDPTTVHSDDDEEEEGVGRNGSPSDGTCLSLPPLSVYIPNPLSICLC